jgi:hypothetical protein
MIRAVAGGVTRRNVQMVVIFTVLLVSTASATRLSTGSPVPTDSGQT